MPSVVRVACLLTLTLAMSACADGGDDPASVARPVVGFILVGERDDLGYNQAVWEASDALARAHPGVRVIRRENVPETDDATAAMEALIADGAGLLFATSFGHLEMAESVASAHPDVVVVHQGGRSGDDLPNLGTFWGDHHELLYIAGIAAAHDTTSGVLGFVAAFPIPSTRANVDAFALGARSVRDDVEVHVSLTGDWCDEDAQRRAYDTVRASGADVVAMHQDCTAALLQWAEDDGVGVVGLHADGSEVAPTSWLTGAVWDWRDIYLGIVEVWREQRFAGSEFDGDYRGTIQDGTSPVVLAEPGPRVDDGVRQELEDVLDDFRRGARSAFDGPVIDADGVVRVPAGASLGVEAIDALDWWAAGVRVLE